MYEVSCPSCHAVVNSPFVRAGAAVTCASCGHRYLIGQTHFKRVAAARADQGTPVQPDVAATTPTGTQPEQGGIQGLSEMMRVEAERERDSQFDDYDTIKPAADEPRKPIDVGPPSVPPPEDKKTKAQKAGRGGYLLAAAAALALAVLGGGMWVINWDLGTGAAAPTTPGPEVPPEPVYEGPMFQGLPLTGSMALEHYPWVQPNQPYVSKPQEDPAVFVADDELVSSDAGVIEYVGRVVSEHEGVIIAGELSVSLVNRQGSERARTTVPIALVSKGQSMQVRMPIPASLDPTALNPVWSITVDEALGSALLIKDVSMTAESMGSDSMALVELTNDTGQPLERAVLLITAWDDQGLPLRRWRVHWDMPIAPSDHVEFYARTAVTPSWRIDSWTVLAIAEPAPNLPTPAPPDAQAD